MKIKIVDNGVVYKHGEEEIVFDLEGPTLETRLESMQELLYTIFTALSDTGDDSKHNSHRLVINVEKQND